MMLQQSLLEVLSDGEWHSGEALGKQFSVSRAAVWKQLQQLQESGINLESERGKGYRVVGAIELLDRESIFAKLTPKTKHLLSFLDLQYSIPSTNTYALEHLARTAAAKGESNPSGLVVFAEQQSAGRGRRGKEWKSALGRNIACSMVWRFSGGAAALSGLSLAIGVALTKALERQGYSGILLKWPNDLLWNDKKLAGILIEMSGDAAGPCDVVVGIGVNLTMSKIEGIDIDQSWVDLLEIGDKQEIKKNALAAEMLNEILPLLAGFEQNGFAYYQSAWAERDALLGKEVAITIGEERFLGQYAGVEVDGAICIKTDQGIRRFNGGEVSLRSSG